MIMEEKKNNPIDTKEKVQQSKDEHIDEDFPGYPHYPAKEDILNPQNHTERVNANVENLTHDSLRNEPADKKKLQEPVNPKEVTGVSPDETKGEDIDDLGIVMGTEADVTRDDLLALGDPNRDLDTDEDEEIFSEGSGSAFEATEETVSDLDSRDLRDELERTGDDLDIPDADLDETSGSLGQVDEENSYYSLGGDRQDNIEEDPTSSY
jgi:hypothetical protein